MTINENGYNKIQINSVLDMDANGQIIKKSLMLNIRADDVKTACKLYEDLKKKIEGEEEKPEKKAKKKNQPESEETAEKETPLCPIHQVPMLLKQNKSNGNLFYGCPHWMPNRKGCNETMPYSTKEGKEIPVDGAQIAAESIPF